MIVRKYDRGCAEQNRLFYDLAGVSLDTIYSAGPHHLIGQDGVVSVQENYPEYLDFQVKHVALEHDRKRVRGGHVQ